jgi:ribosomal protein S18 acetylase RimI-like enzyme
LEKVLTDHALNILIREAANADLPHLGRLGALLVQEHHDFDQRRFLAAKNRTPQDYASFLATRLEDRNAVILVAEIKGETIGYAYAEIEGYDYMSLRGPAGVLNDLIVDPAYRGQGVGGLLLDAIISRLQSCGAPRVVLSTAAKNKSAQRLFERNGFRPTMIEMTRELEEPSE